MLIKRNFHKESWLHYAATCIAHGCRCLDTGIYVLTLGKYQGFFAQQWLLSEMNERMEDD